MRETFKKSETMVSVIGFGMLGVALYSLQLFWSFSSFASPGDAIGIAVAILFTLPSLFAVIDLIGKAGKRRSNKFIWLIAVTIGGFAGAAVYFGYNYGRKP